MPMCDGQDLDVGFSLTVNNRERKALQNELAGSLQTLRPTVRSLRYQVCGLIYVGNEIDGCGLVSLQVRSNRGFPFFECFRV